jgi:hypothetical protein
VNEAMDACVANFERFMALIMIDPKKTEKIAQLDVPNQKVMTKGE